MDPGGFELTGHGVLFLRCLHRDIQWVLADSPLLPHHRGNLITVSVTADEQPLNRALVDSAVRHDCGRVEQTENLFEGLGITVVRCCRREKERFGGRRQRASKLVVLCAHVGGIVDLVDHHRIPTDLFQLRAILGTLEGVHRHNDAGEISERISASRKDSANALDSV